MTRATAGLWGINEVNIIGAAPGCIWARGSTFTEPDASIRDCGAPIIIRFYCAHIMPFGTHAAHAR